MTEKNKTKTKADGSKTAKRNNAKGAEREKNDEIEQASRQLHQILPFVLGVFAFFLAVCFISVELTGVVGRALSGLFYGTFGAGAIVLPAMIILLAIFWRKRLKEKKLIVFIIVEAALYLLITAMLHIWTGGTKSFVISTLWTEGQSLTGGGIIGGTVGLILRGLTGTVGAHIIGITAILVLTMLLFNKTPYHVWLFIKYYIHEKREARKAHVLEDETSEVTVPRAKRRQADAEQEDYSRVKRDPIDRHRFEPDVDVGINDESDSVGSDDTVTVESEEDIPPFDLDGKKVELIAPIEVSKGRISKLPDLPIKSDEENVDLSEIFSDSDGADVLKRFAEEQKAKELARQKQNEELEITREAVAQIGASESEKKEYEFPPISLLKIDTSPKNYDISDELHSNATKLVDTLKSFKVRTKIVNVSRGPTITRYELQPEEGVRVRSISNLVDDIALNLATSGVRIEAPIPGKAAVGVEVPNKSVSTVYLRELVDTESFRKVQSKLNIGLGVDVAGDPVFLDIAKMPHLLIAGATGMGKSVCINSVIVSLLYKSNPDEVKLMLIDPKKVEFSLYNGLPHLLVPVVSDPKKAAGSLQWAVTEMERRFELIEEVGVRDLANYNAVTKDDPEKEFLPQVVIIIDELADLMMTAPDDVETSICRLAQKARAAGMHLIIGTQRPSVDVITGLIKANIPSRIAFTVSSQTDSRVILDISGAEKLIGRGDMLYAPIGASKPIRVQGAFVSEREVENIVTYIREHNTDTEYSTEIIESINRAAASCGNKKGSGTAFDDTDSDGIGMSDPMLRPAIELAIESGKISTSLIQRRLSLGYGRAAKLIDEMQIRGFVSPPEGQKPRNVLITKEQYMEMILDRKEDLG